jgi:hypothetical protein
MIPAGAISRPVVPPPAGAERRPISHETRDVCTRAAHEGHDIPAFFPS